MLTWLCRHLARLRWAYALTASGILFVLSSAPIRQPVGWPALDKVEHVTAYTLLGLAYYNVGSAGGRRAGWTVAIATWLAVVAYGISDEFHQAFVPGRSAEVADVLADAVGGMLGVAAALGMRRGFVRRLEE
ncbi:MAG: VanZ family protein [SAR324 cluster bacterium]